MHWSISMYKVTHKFFLFICCAVSFRPMVNRMLKRETYIGALRVRIGQKRRNKRVHFLISNGRAGLIGSSSARSTAYATLCAFALWKSFMSMRLPTSCLSDKKCSSEKQAQCPDWQRHWKWLRLFYRYCIICACAVATSFPTSAVTSPDGSVRLKYMSMPCRRTPTVMVCVSDIEHRNEECTLGAHLWKVFWAWRNVVFWRLFP